jgi:hypothetical protein
MPHNELPTNQELAKQYFAVVSQSSASWDTYMTIENLIATCPIGIAAQYLTIGSLRDLNVPGIGAKTKAVLETILAEGLSVARSDYGERKESSIRKQFFGPSPRVFGTDLDYEDLTLEHENAQASVHKTKEDLSPE